MPPTVVGAVMLAEEIEALIAAQRPTSESSYLATGGGVSLVSGLTFRIGAGSAFIRGTLFTFPQADIALTAADATNDRFDLIIADAGLGTFDKITGTAAANPALPSYDPLTQLVITQVLVPATATTIPSIVKTALYHDAPDSGITVTTSGGTIVSTSTSQPLAGTKCIEATNAAAEDWVKTTLASAVLVASANQLVLNIKSKANWPNQKSLQLQWMLAGAKVGQVVSLADKFFGLVSSQTATYQQIVILIGNFKLPAGTTADALEIRVKGSGSPIGFRLDDIVIESSTVISTPSPTPRATSSQSGTVRTVIDATDPQVETRIPMTTTFSKGGAALDVTSGLFVGSHSPRLRAGKIAKIEVIPYGGTVTSGTLKFRKGVSSGYPGSMADITAAADLALSAGSGVQSVTSFVGWTTTYLAGDMFEVELFAFVGTAKSLTVRIIPEN